MQTNFGTTFPREHRIATALSRPPSMPPLALAVLADVAVVPRALLLTSPLPRPLSFSGTKVPQASACSFSVIYYGHRAVGAGSSFSFAWTFVLSSRVDGPWPLTRRSAAMEKTKYAGIYKAASGYRVRAYATDPKTGKIKEVDRVLKGISLKEAIRRQADLRDEIARCGEADATPQTTLGDYAKLWLERRSERWKMSTLMGAAKTLEQNILPNLGPARLDRLTKGDIEDWMSRLHHRPHHRTGKPLSNNTVNHSLRLLKTILKDAVADLRLPHDPTDRVSGLPEVPRPENDPNCLSAKQVPVVLGYIREHHPRAYPYIFIDVTTAMRTSEITALKWSDINEEDGVIRLRRGQVRGFVSTPKTGKVREIPLTPEMVEVLREHRQRMIREQHRGLASGLVFPSETGSYHYASWTDKILRRVVQECNIGHRITMHGLRRTYNNLMRRAGVQYLVIQATVGHSSDEMTNHYSSVGLDEKREAAARLMSAIKAPEATAFCSALGDQLGDRRFGLTVEGS
ncbi:MAG: site-specific integrase [Deltaproteobacteria bacterium]|nr:site-specific integrase [Deltaproteobacteria bacterium]